MSSSLTGVGDITWDVQALLQPPHLSEELQSSGKDVVHPAVSGDRQQGMVSQVINITVEQTHTEYHRPKTN